MKKTLQKLFSPLLNRFEPQEGTEFVYKPSHRKILIVVGLLFFVLSSVSLAASIIISEPGALFPTLLFGLLGLVCFVVGFLGSDGAVAKLWNSR